MKFVYALNMRRKEEEGVATLFDTLGLFFLILESTLLELIIESNSNAENYSFQLL